MKNIQAYAVFEKSSVVDSWNKLYGEERNKKEYQSSGKIKKKLRDWQ